MKSYLIIRASEQPEEPRYTRDAAAQLARITLDFLQRCEREELIRAQLMTGGGHGFSTTDVQELARIRRLRDDLELDLAAVDIVLHLRRQVVALLEEIQAQEQRHARREQQLLNEIQALRRRLAQEAQYRR